VQALSAPLGGRFPMLAGLQGPQLYAAAFAAAALLLAAFRALRFVLSKAWAHATGPQGAGRQSWQARMLCVLFALFGGDVVTAERLAPQSEQVQTELASQESSLASVTGVRKGWGVGAGSERRLIAACCAESGCL